jgi:PAS domain S-box-containing protein
MSAHFAALVDALPVGIVIHRNRRIIYANQVCVEALGLRSTDQLLGRDPLEFLPPEDRERHARRLAEVEGEATILPTQARLTTAAGNAYALQLVAFRIDFDGEPAQVSLVRDITAEQEAQVALEKSEARNQAILESALEETGRAREANRLKSEFLANVSHEVRTPLNAILGFADLLEAEELGPLSGRQLDAASNIVCAGRHLLRLIDDVLDLAKAESGHTEFHPERVELALAVSEVVAVLAPIAAAKQIAVATELDPRVPVVTIDAKRLRQVLYNYLSNALKFTAHGGRVVVRTRPEGEHRFRVEVQDNGIGVRLEDVGRLFVEFQQLDAGLAKHYAGAGLGLAITKRLVEAQGGAVGVETRFGQGSTFHAVLPREPVVDVRGKGKRPWRES